MPFFDSIAHNALIRRSRSTHARHTEHTMFRKTLVFATVLLAFAATHAEDAPKITHKVRDAAHFEATRSRVEDSTSGRLSRDAASVNSSESR